MYKAESNLVSLRGANARRGDLATCMDEAHFHAICIPLTMHHPFTRINR